MKYYMTAVPAILIAICTFSATAQPPVNAPPSLVTTGNAQVTTGIPHLNLGFPTQHVIDPSVGNVVQLAHGFDHTPDFTYSFTHPLARFTHPLTSPGSYGTYGGSVVQPGLGAGKAVPHTTARLSTKPTNLSTSRPHDPKMNMKFLPAPWHVASQKAKFVPHAGVYAHHSITSPVKGAYITGVAVDGIGHKAGLMPGDVITSINDTKLHVPRDYANMVDQLQHPASIGVWNAHTNRESQLKWPGHAPTR